MLVRLRQLQDQVKSSLFVVPAIFVAAAVVLGEVMVLVDEKVESIPDEFTATVDSAREVLSVVAGATLSFAGIAFSISLLLVSMASSQYSPRVVHGLFRDPFNKRIMGSVVGTFTYCLVVLRNVRGPLEEGGDPVVPSLSILVAVALGVLSVVLIVAFISHNAHSMDVSQILHRVTEQSLDQVRTAWVEEEPEHEGDIDRPEGPSCTIVFDRDGWIQQIDYDALIEGLEPGSCLELATMVGRYAIPGTPLCTVWPAPDDEAELGSALLAAVAIGESRTMQQDVTYGVRQLADVALKALSPGVNDPTTAQDAIFHLGAVVREMLTRTAPARLVERDDRRLLLPEALGHDELIGLAFDEIRLSSVGQPTVQIYLLEVLSLLEVSLAADDVTRAVLRRQADLILDVAGRADLPRSDRQRVVDAHWARFGRADRPL